MAQSELQKNQSSSAEEEESSSEGSESEPETEKTTPPPPLSEKTQSTSEESESDADSAVKNSDIVDPNVKPLTAIPMSDETLKPPPPNPITGKRKAEVENEAKETKIVKKELVPVENAGEKKPLFQRLWSEDDEIELIKGMISYLEKKGKDPIADVADFHEFVKNSLSIDVNIGQMNAKVRRLKAKFMNNAGKIEEKGKVRSLSNPHEKKMYELSEKLWSSNRNSDKNKKAVVISCSTKKVDANSKTNQRQTNNKSTVPGEAKAKVNLPIEFPVTEEYIVQKGLESLSGPKKAELEEKWNNLKMQELKHFVKKLDVVQEQTEKILYVIEKSHAS